jgi:hypothetical protein
LIIPGTSHVKWKVLQYESWSLSVGGHLWYKRNTREKKSLIRLGGVCVCKSLYTISNFLTDFFICLWFFFSIFLQSASISSFVRQIVTIRHFIGTENLLTLRQPWIPFASYCQIKWYQWLSSLSGILWC